MSGIGLYIHVPFCVRKCRYCDFFSVCDLSLVPRFLAALDQEIARRATRVQRRADTIYFGGGTPSLLPPQAVAAILSEVRESFGLGSRAEITLEVNPGTVDARQLESYRRAGVNRLSIGVQSFQPDELALLGRLHSTDQARRVLRWSRSAGFENIGIDLIYAIPGQTPARWRSNLEAALDFSPDHFSCYALSLEPGTPLAQELRCGRIAAVGERRVAALYQLMVDLLDKAGYRQYEISNFSRGPRFDSRHNCKYWNFEPYLGLGPAAHSFLPPQRCWNTADLATYLQALESGRSAVEERETITRSQAMVEAVYLGLRQTRGIDPSAFARRFRIDVAARLGKLVQRLADGELMRFCGGRWCLTVSGMLLLDRIAAEMVACLPEV